MHTWERNSIAQGQLELVHGKVCGSFAMAMAMAMELERKGGLA